MKKHKKIVSICLIIIAALALFNIYFLNPKLSGKNLVEQYNASSLNFHYKYQKLLEEQARMSVLAYQGATEDQIVDQMDVITDQAQVAYDELMVMYEYAKKMEENSQSSLISDANAQEQALDSLKNVLSATPVVGRLVKGFDSSMDHMRLGLYKAYYMDSVVGDKDYMDEELKKLGLEKIEDILTAKPVIVTTFYRNTRCSIPDIHEQVNMVRMVTQQGASAVLGYYDSILVVAGIKETDLTGEAVDETLDQLGIPPDLKGFVKFSMGGGDIEDMVYRMEPDISGENFGNYAKNKAKDKALEIYEDILVPKEIDALLNDDTKAKEELLKKLEAEKAKKESRDETTDKTEKKSGGILDSILAVSDKVVQLGADLARDLMDIPYHLWPVDKQRDLAGQLNQVNGSLLLTAAVNPAANITAMALPQGIWNITIANDGKTPVFNPQVEKIDGQETVLVDLSKDLNDVSPLIGDNLILNAREPLTLQRLRALSKTGVKVNTNKCISDWSCDYWSDCINKVQTRECVDLNNCGTNTDKPAESQECREPVWECGEWSLCAGQKYNGSDFIKGTQTRECEDVNNTGSTQSMPLTTQECCTYNECVNAGYNACDDKYNKNLNDCVNSSKTTCVNSCLKSCPGNCRANYFTEDQIAACVAQCTKSFCSSQCEAMRSTLRSECEKYFKSSLSRCKTTMSSFCSQECP